MTELPTRERLDIERQAAKRLPVAARIFKQRLVLGDPDMAALACEPPIHDNRCDLPSLTRSGPVAKEEALSVGVPIFGQFQRGALLADTELTRKIARERLGSVDQCLALRFGEQATGLPTCGETRGDFRLRCRDRTHGDRFHERGGMNGRVFERDAAGPVRQVDACLFRHRRRFG